MTVDASGALDALLERVASAMANATPGHRATFAALLAECAGDPARDEDDRANAAFETLWRVAEDGAPDAGTIRAAELDIATVRNIGASVDLDRVRAFDVLRSLTVLEEALRCAAGLAGGPHALTFAFLAAACDVAARAPNARIELLERWHWERVGDAVRYIDEALVTRTPPPGRAARGAVRKSR